MQSYQLCKYGASKLPSLAIKWYKSKPFSSSCSSLSSIAEAMSKIHVHTHMWVYSHMSLGIEASHVHVHLQTLINILHAFTGNRCNFGRINYLKCKFITHVDMQSCQSATVNDSVCECSNWQTHTAKLNSPDRVKSRWWETASVVRK